MVEPTPHFVLEGKPFCFAGASHYSLTYKSEAAALDVVQTAAEAHLAVLRLWGFLDWGSLDGSVLDIHPLAREHGV